MWHSTPIFLQLVGNCEGEEIGSPFLGKEGHQTTLYFKDRGVGNWSSPNSRPMGHKDLLPGADAFAPYIV